MLNKAECLIKMGNIEDSLRTLDDVLSLDPKHQFALEFQNSVQIGPDFGKSFQITSCFQNSFLTAPIYLPNSF